MNEWYSVPIDLYVLQDIGEARNEFGQFIHNVTSKEKRALERLKGITDKKVSMIFDENFYKMYTHFCSFINTSSFLNKVSKKDTI